MSNYAPTEITDAFYSATHKLFEKTAAYGLENSFTKSCLHQFMKNGSIPDHKRVRLEKRVKTYEDIAQWIEDLEALQDVFEKQEFYKIKATFENKGKLSDRQTEILKRIHKTSIVDETHLYQ